MQDRWGPGREKASAWLMRELRLACAVSGLSQRALAKRTGLHPSRLNRFLRGHDSPDIDVARRLIEGAGYRLLMKVVPSDGVRLRDSGQLGVADGIVREAHRSWRHGLELPVAPAPDRRAADLVLDNGRSVLMVEIERWLRDFQAQLRSAQLKRTALAELMGRDVRLILAVLDTAANRAAIAPHRALIQEALPLGSRRIWAAIRSGESPGGEGILWVRSRA